MIDKLEYTKLTINTGQAGDVLVQSCQGWSFSGERSECSSPVGPKVV